MTKQSMLRALPAAFILLLASGLARGQAYLTQAIDTTALNTATYDTLSGNAGPFPFKNFGVQATDSLGLLVAASVNGSTTFTFPTFTPGQTLAVGSTFNYAYNPSWSGGSIGANAGLSASASFNYNLGPFSGSSSIFDTALNASANGNIAGGSTLTGSTANGTAYGPTYNFGLSESAIAASASVGVNVGVKLQTAISYSPTVQYGYYTWVNTTGTYSASDVLTWHGVSGGALSYDFDDTLPSQAGASTFFVNFAPGVQVDLPITPTSTVQLPVSGELNVSILGQTIVDDSVPLGTISAYTADYDTWDDDMDFTGKYYSLELTAADECNNYAYVANPGNCENYTVDGSGPLLGQKVNLPGGSSGNLTGGAGIGSWDGNYSNAPLVPGVCDRSTGACYASNDPNLPTGPGTVTTTDIPVGTPEPSPAPLLAIAVLAIVGFCRGRFSAPV
jgi:hypothetical protein